MHNTTTRVLLATLEQQYSQLVISIIRIILLLLLLVVCIHQEYSLVLTRGALYDSYSTRVCILLESSNDNTNTSSQYAKVIYERVIWIICMYVHIILCIHKQYYEQTSTSSQYAYSRVLLLEQQIYYSSQSMRSLISTTTVVVFTERVRMYDSILHVRLDDDSFSSYYTCVYVSTLVHACIVMHKMVNIILARVLQSSSLVIIMHGYGTHHVRKSSHITL